MKKHVSVIIDCAREKTPVEVHTAIARQLGFPAYYGANLDALHDCLSEVVLEKSIVLEWKDSKHSKHDAKMVAIKNMLSEATS